MPSCHSINWGKSNVFAVKQVPVPKMQLQVWHRQDVAVSENLILGLTLEFLSAGPWRKGPRLLRWLEDCHSMTYKPTVTG